MPPGRRDRGTNTLPNPDRLQVDTGITGARGADEVVQGDVVGTGQREQQLQGHPAAPALQPGQRALRDPGHRRKCSQGDAAFAAQRPQPGPHGAKRVLRFTVHRAILQELQDGVPIRDGPGKSGPRSPGNDKNKKGHR
ncbi:hypothetical protein GCM10019016_127440 [Streptomyces prasinosporus]|uniref:Uncharacterized protein n=1 Tax=Streptomyces prasinosporus TaxID=68256 RepID=A0ABP6UHF1_9ACTN